VGKEKLSPQYNCVELLILSILTAAAINFFLKPKLNDYDTTETGTLAIRTIIKIAPRPWEAWRGMSKTLHVTFQTLAIYAKNQDFL
jgi:hypothetical protein